MGVFDGFHDDKRDENEINKNNYSTDDFFIIGNKLY